MLAPDAAPTHLTRVAGLTPDELAVSVDGKRWAVVTHAQSGSSLALVEGEVVRRSVTVGGHRMLDPHFSPDGATVTFSARGLSEVPHSVSRNYAQLWRVAFARGEPTKLTSSDGCHELPRPLRDGRLLFVHATCAGGRALELLTGAKESRPVRDLGEVREAAATADGGRVVFSRLAPTGLELLELRLAGGAPTRLGVVQAEGARQRLAWDFDERGVLFQTRGTVYRLKPGGAVDEVTRLSGAAR